MGKRILVVDDDQGICLLLRDLLEGEAYEVDLARDGLTAWEKLTLVPGAYEAVVLDVHLPRLDGLQLIQMLRDWREAMLGIILVASSDVDAIQQARAMGVGRALSKPFDLEEVLAQVAICSVTSCAYLNRIAAHE